MGFVRFVVKNLKIGKIHMESDYSIYRGKCKEASEEACKKDSSLTLVRGYYYCPIWNTQEQHWWTVRENGKIYDPTRKQFPSIGFGVYTKFDGNLNCSECGKDITEDTMTMCGNYPVCSTKCAMRLVGL